MKSGATSADPAAQGRAATDGQSGQGRSARLYGEGLAADKHDEGDDAEGEDVHGGGVRPVVHHLRRHEARRPQASCGRRGRRVQVLVSKVLGLP